MDWIHNYQLFLFDFDGLLVDTEALHLEAYRRMCQEHGFKLEIDLVTYNRVAQFDASGPSIAIYGAFPSLKNIEWEILRKRKNQIYLEILESQAPALMEGVEELLQLLASAKIKRGVVTHSRPEQIESIKKRHPILNTIENWLTRVDYEKPKPNPECYLKAKATWGEGCDKVIGFEDSPKGLKALIEAGVESVMVTPYFNKSEAQELVQGTFCHVNSIKDFMEKKTSWRDCKPCSSPIPALK